MLLPWFQDSGPKHLVWIPDHSEHQQKCFWNIFQETSHRKYYWTPERAFYTNPNTGPATTHCDLDSDSVNQHGPSQNSPCYRIYFATTQESDPTANDSGSSSNWELSDSSSDATTVSLFGTRVGLFLRKARFAAGVTTTFGFPSGRRFRLGTACPSTYYHGRWWIGFWIHRDRSGSRRFPTTSRTHIWIPKFHSEGPHVGRHFLRMASGG